MRLKVCGVDLAVSRSRCSGYALIEVSTRHAVLVKLKCLHSINEVVNEVLSDGASVVAIDAPLSGGGAIREVERAMWRRGFRVLPPSIPGMRVLARAGESLANELRRHGLKVIETHPSSAIKSAGAKSLHELTSKLNVEVSNHFKELCSECRDLRDAVISALVAYCYVKECALPIKGGSDIIYLIKPLRSG